jgi:membrane protein YdbS with pleckstrin-like domain
MSFSNSAVDLAPISVDNLELIPISKRYRTINIALSALFTIIVLSILLVLDFNVIFDELEWFERFKYVVYSAVLFLAFWDILYHFFADPIIKYAVRQQDLHFQSGLMFRRLVSQPILRIQHIELKRGPIERKAGLATLQVFSAGGVSHTFQIPGMEFEKAIALRKFIINHKDLSLDE